MLIVPRGCSIPQTVTVVKENNNYLILIYNCVIVIHCYSQLNNGHSGLAMGFLGNCLIVIGY